jgi:hypothetical protein
MARAVSKEHFRVLRLQQPPCKLVRGSIISNCARDFETKVRLFVDDSTEIVRNKLSLFFTSVSRTCVVEIMTSWNARRLCFLFDYQELMASIHPAPTRWCSLKDCFIKLWKSESILHGLVTALDFNSGAVRLKRVPKKSTMWLLFVIAKKTIVGSPHNTSLNKSIN